MKRSVLLVCATLSAVCMFFSSCSKEDATDLYIRVKSVEYEVGKVKVNIGSNVEWSVVSNQEWAKLQQTSGIGNSSVEVSITPGLSVEKRLVELSFTSVDESLRQTFVLSLPAIKNYFKTPFIEGTAKKDEPYQGVLTIPYTGVENEMNLVLNVIPTGVASGGFNPVSDFEVTIVNDGEIRIPISGTPVQIGNVDFNITGLLGIENMVCSFSIHDLYILKGAISTPDFPKKPNPDMGRFFNPNNYGDRTLQNEKLPGYGLEGWSIVCAGIVTNAIIVANQNNNAIVTTPKLSSITNSSTVIVSFDAYTLNGTSNRSITINLCSSKNVAKSSKDVTVDEGGYTGTGDICIFNAHMKKFEVEFENVEGTDYFKFEIPKGDPVFFKDFVVQYK